MNNLTTDLEAVMQKIAGGGPHEWGYRDVTDGTFIEDDWPFDAQNFLRNYGDAIREMQGEIERLREANGILEDGLQEVGDDYPGSSCQQWCQNMIANARAALNPKGEAQ